MNLGPSAASGSGLRSKVIKLAGGSNRELPVLRLPRISGK
jgi:hypothetical protein